MDTNKTNNNRLCAIWHGLARNASYKQYIGEKDVEVFRTRCANEGTEFYARGLTALRTCLLNALETGRLVLGDEVRFSRVKDSVLPQFMRLAWEAVFEPLTGILLGHDLLDAEIASREKSGIESECTEERDSAAREIARLRIARALVPNIDAVACLNQLTAVFGKIEGGHTKESDVRLIQSFRDTEIELASLIFDEQMLLPHTTRPGEPGKVKLCAVLDIAQGLIREVVSTIDWSQIEPRHGSGASACGTLVHERYHKPRFIESIDKLWDYSSYYMMGPSQLCDDTQATMVRVPGTNKFRVQKYLAGLEILQPTAKVILVPKDARGQRLISCEPRETMWIQQGLLPVLQGRMEQCALTRGQINFTDQTLNQKGAFYGSISRKSATLDLKDASDRVSMKLIQRLFPEIWVTILTACRSAHTQLPDGSLVSLCKHAPMGSALCFPIMALCIWALVTAATRTKSKSGKTPGVLVYGDDIVVPSHFVGRVITVLEAVGLRVNRNKSFVDGFFRESCGKEYFHGVDVTPVRVRTNPDDSVPARMKTIAFHNNLFKANGAQPVWLTELIHSWYKHVPERSVQYQSGISFDWCFKPSVCDTIESDSLSAVLDVYIPDNQHITSRSVRAPSGELTPASRPYYGTGTEYRYLDVVPVGIKYPTDCWSQVFRAVVNPRIESQLGWDALAKRVSYKYRWKRLR